MQKINLSGKKVLINLLLIQKVAIFVNYSDFINGFPNQIAKILHKYMIVNKYIIV